MKDVAGNEYEDVVDVLAKHGHGPHAYEDAALTVEIVELDVPGNRETDVPSILLQEYGRYQLYLTWQEAEALAKALTDVVGIARNG